MEEHPLDQASDAYVLQAQGLTKKYGDLVAVDHLGLLTKKGEVFGFLRPNGAGKTASINMIVGLLTSTSGTILSNGHERAHSFPPPRLGTAFGTTFLIYDLLLWTQVADALRQMLFLAVISALSRSTLDLRSSSRRSPISSAWSVTHAYGCDQNEEAA